MLNHAIRFAILGPGTIARGFVDGLARAPDARLVAVGSRSIDRAHAFADEFAIARRHGSYQALAADPEVDVVYIASPHSEHAAHALACIAAGKAVLVEKPFTRNAAEAETVIAAARARGVFAMEAMWSRFVPALVRARALLSEGAIGRPSAFLADFAFPAQVPPEHRLLNPQLAGGAMLDIGIYPVSLATWLLGPVDAVQATGTLGETGVDIAASVSLRHAGGAVSALLASFGARGAQEARVLGSAGHLTLHAPFYKTQRITLSVRDREPETIHLPYQGSGYQFEANEVARCLRAGKSESELMPLADTLAVMCTLDDIRRQIGVRYPGE